MNGELMRGRNLGINVLIALAGFVLAIAILLPPRAATAAPFDNDLRSSAAGTAIGGARFS
jgi:hypothetical protein